VSSVLKDRNFGRWSSHKIGNREGLKAGKGEKTNWEKKNRGAEKWGLE